MPIKTAYSTKSAINEITEDIKSQFSGAVPKLLVYFASPRHDVKALSTAMSGLYPDAKIIGCTTAGEIVSGKMLKGSVVAMALGSDIISDAAIEIVEKISSENQVAKAFDAFSAYYGEPILTMDSQKYVGLILVDGLRGAEEKLMDTIGNLTDVIFIGGSAGDDVKFKATYIFAGGKTYTDAAVVALLKPAIKFDFIKSQSFRTTGKKLTATKVIESKRMAVEFNDKPAAVAYAEALAITSDKVSEKFMTNPVGLMVGGDPYVRSPQQLQDSSIIFYCNIKNGMELEILQSGDIVKDTAKSLEEKKKSLKKISGIINFNCILRTLELDAKGQSDEYGKLFSDIPTVGFSTYGEEYIGHINQTATMLLFY
jgi:hypothetical protein